MNVRWVSQFALPRPPTVSIQKVAKSAGAQKATREMESTVWVRKLCVEGSGRGQALENHWTLGVVVWEKTGYNCSDTFKSKRGVVWSVQTDIFQFLVNSQVRALWPWPHGLAPTLCRGCFPLCLSSSFSGNWVTSVPDQYSVLWAIVGETEQHFLCHWIWQLNCGELQSWHGFVGGHCCAWRFYERVHWLALDKFKPLTFKYKQWMIKTSVMIAILCQGLGVAGWVGSSLTGCHLPFQVSVAQRHSTSEDLTWSHPGPVK